MKIEMQFLPDVQRHMRGVRRQALQPRDAGGHLQGQEHRRRARHDDRGSQPVLPRRARRGRPAGGDGGRGVWATCGLGQGANTLSGGEAQRVKLGGGTGQEGDRAAPCTSSTSRRPGCTSPTSPSSWKCLFKLRDAGNTLIVIEHNLEVIKCADWMIDLGPEGGAAGWADRRRGHAGGNRRAAREHHRAVSGGETVSLLPNRTINVTMRTSLLFILAAFFLIGVSACTPPVTTDAPGIEGAGGGRRDGAVRWRMPGFR